MERNTRSWLKSICSFALLVTGCVMLLGWGSPAHAGSCSPRAGTRTDPNTGLTWNTLWYCGNRAGAAVYGDANSGTQTGTMKSTTSWFVCFRIGETHAGGNNIWYYTLGDVAVSNLVMHEGTHSGAWGYMPAVNVLTSTDPWPGMPACPQGKSPPDKTQSFDKPIYFIHGYADNINVDGVLQIAGPSFDCGEYWNTVLSSFFNSGEPASLTGPNARLIKWGFYHNDRNCTRVGAHDGAGLSDFRNVPIKTLGADLAWDIYLRYTRWGDSVDVVAHSMGGLVLKAALTGTARGDPDFPPYLYVEDAMTLSTPHQGVPISFACGALNGNQQCQDMFATPCTSSPTSCFLKWVYMNPSTRVFTDWTFVASDNDFVVPAWSALAIGTASIAPANGLHKVVYTKPQPGGQILGHMNYLWSNSGTWNALYCDWGGGCDLLNRGTWFTLNGTWDPIRLMRYATYYGNW